MAVSVQDATRTLTVTLPETLARRIEEVALEQRTDTSELMQWAMRVYLQRLADAESGLNEPLDPENPSSMTLASVFLWFASWVSSLRIASILVPP